MTIHLFAGHRLADHLAAISDRLLARADRLPPAAWGPGDEPTPNDVLAAMLAASEGLSVPSLDWTQLRLQTVETTVPIVDTDRGQITIQHVRGLCVLASVPYLGDRQLLTCRPTEHSIGGFDPRASIRPAGTGTGHLLVEIAGRHLHDDTIMRDLERIALDIEKHLGYARADLGRWAQDLAPRLEQTVTARRAFHDELSDLDRRLSNA